VCRVAQDMEEFKWRPAILHSNSPEPEPGLVVKSMEYIPASTMVKHNVKCGTAIFTDTNDMTGAYYKALNGF